jgi:hypothetical protein
MSAQIGAIEQAIQAVKTGELSQADIAVSVDRVHDLKHRYLASTFPIPTSTLATSEARIPDKLLWLLRFMPKALQSCEAYPDHSPFL